MKKRTVSIHTIILSVMLILSLSAFVPSGPAYHWEFLHHDFGKIKKDRPVSAAFTFRNSGDAPLLITEAKAGCGCTVAEFTKAPVAVGESGSIKVTFNAAKLGTFTKTVQVTSNVNGAPATIEISGEVIE